MSDLSRSDVQDRIDRYWSFRADAYDAYQQRPERLQRDRDAWSHIFAAALPPPPARVLDVGTGSGYVALLLADLGYDVTRIDRAPGMLDIARRHAAGRCDLPRFELGDAVDPPGRDEVFDAVTNRYLMWTLRDPARALRSWMRLLRPGGTLALVDATWFPHGLDAGLAPFTDHYDERVRAALPLAAAVSIADTASAVREAGFADVTVTPLPQILHLDRRFGTAPHHDVHLQYLVAGHRPTGPG